MRYGMWLLCLLWFPGCDALWGGLARNNPANCVQDPSICGPGQICNRITEVCEPGPGGGAGDMGPNMGPGPAPVIDRIQPRRVSSQVGGSMSIEGMGFLPGASVDLALGGANPSAMVSTITPTQIVAMAPRSQGTCGPVPVRVTNPDGQSATRNDLFGYFLAQLTFSKTLSKLMVPWSNNSSHHSVLSADMNGDGKLDLATLFTAGINSGVAVFHGRGDGTFNDAAWSYTKNTPLTAIAVGQLAGGTAPEVVVASSNSLHIFTDNQPQPFSLSSSSTITGLALADMNGDGRLDVVVSTDNNTNNLLVYLNQGNGNFQTEPPIVVCLASSLLVADFDGNGHPDVALACAAQRLTIVLNPASSNTQTIRQEMSVSPHSLAAADFDGDGKQDLAVAGRNQGGNQIQILQGTFSSLSQLAIGNISSSIRIAAADLNCDLRPDLVYTTTGSDLGWLLNMGMGMWSSSPIEMTGTGMEVPMGINVGITTGDFNGDGRPDVITSLGTEEVRLFSNTGS